jgi:hypothetical protein
MEKKPDAAQEKQPHQELVCSWFLLHSKSKIRNFPDKNLALESQ